MSSVDGVNKHGNSALHFAHEFGHDKLVEGLKSKWSANTSAENTRGFRWNERPDPDTGGVGGGTDGGREGEEEGEDQFQDHTSEAHHEMFGTCARMGMGSTAAPLGSL